MRVAAALLALVAIATTAPALSVASCSGDCVISGSTSGFSPSILRIPSGTSVHWTSADAPHFNVDGERPIESYSCFGEYYDHATPSPPVRFEIVGLSVTATDARGGSWPCTTAHGAPGGPFALRYFCSLHGNMRGTLVIEP